MLQQQAKSEKLISIAKMATNVRLNKWRESIIKTKTIVEVKREKEKLREEQITWAEFLINNKIPYKVVRVVSR